MGRPSFKFIFLDFCFNLGRKRGNLVIIYLDNGALNPAFDVLFAHFDLNVDHVSHGQLIPPSLCLHGFHLEGLDLGLIHLEVVLVQIAHGLETPRHRAVEFLVIPLVLEFDKENVHNGLEHVCTQLQILVIC